MHAYLDFEAAIAELEGKIAELKAISGGDSSVSIEEEIKNAPLFSRNFLDLASLAPGVVIRDGGEIDPTKSFGYRTVGVNGRSGTGTRVQIDGIDVTDETVGTTTANISDEAVSEFQLTRSSLVVPLKTAPSSDARATNSSGIG